MMRRFLLLPVLVIVVLVMSAPGAAGAEAMAATAVEPVHHDRVTVSDLLADPQAYERVVVQGELVGDFGRRSDGTVWTQCNGDAYAGSPLREGGSLAGANVGIGVRIPADVWPDLDRPGGYRYRGPIVELQGIWRYHDPARGGESYLDVTGLEVLEAARPLSEPMNWLPLGLGAGLLALTLAVGLATRRRHH